jgi:hypothetical protein
MIYKKRNVSASAETKKVLWVIERKTLELELVKYAKQAVVNESVDVVSLQYWLFQPNLLAYDVIVLPFVPSEPSAHFSLFESVLQYGVSVVVLNWWQQKFEAEIEYRERSLRLLSGYHLYLCSCSEEYTDYLQRIGFKNKIIISAPLIQALLNAAKNHHKPRSASKEYVLSCNFGMAFADDYLIDYRKKTGYSEKDIDDNVKYSRRFLDKFFEDLDEFSYLNKNSRLSIAAYPPSQMSNLLKEIKSRRIQIPGNIKLINETETIKCLERSSVLITNIEDLAQGFSASAGTSIIYRPIDLPARLRESNLTRGFSIKNLSYDLDSYSIQPRVVENVDYTRDFDFRCLLDLVNNINKRSKIASLKKIYIKYQMLRFRVMLYNLKQQVLKVASGKNNEHSDYFFPFKLKIID